MIGIDATRAAELVATIHAPWCATVGECVNRWATLDAATRATSYMVVRGDEPGARQTLNGSSIAELAAQL
jgi:hypothetical protein